MPPSPNVSLPFDILIRDLLGHNHYVPISQLTAEVILMHTGNRHSCHIQFPSDNDVDVTGRFIDHPLLWDLNAWNTSVERYRKQKLRAQQEREARFVLEGNTRLIARALMRFANIESDPARCLAHQFLTKKDYARIKAVGVKRLYENVNELPN